MDRQINGTPKNVLDIAIVGAGLVGSLEALYLARRGHRIQLYEYREESEKYSNVQTHFNHKLLDANLHKGDLTFMRTDTRQTVQINTDLVIGADGAFSAVRRAMMKQPLFDYSQKYIEHGYLELCIPPGQDGGNFKDLSTDETLLAFFDKYFPDSVPLIGKNKLLKDFFSGSPSALVAVKCRPYNVSDKALIIGDAAHAVVPFYGQGMNAGFEDCTILDRLFVKHSDDLALILNEFSETRWEDTHAISDLAMYNYIEMRDLVSRPSYHIRKILDDFLYRLMPNYWVPLYNSVTFTTMPYKRCTENRRWQDKIFTGVFYFSVLVFAICVFMRVSRP